MPGYGHDNRAATLLHLDLYNNFLGYHTLSWDRNGPRGPILVDVDDGGCFCEYGVEP
jgi:hypothetical protein